MLHQLDERVVGDLPGRDRADTFLDFLLPLNKKRLSILERDDLGDS
jgi:hypothetical protein